MSKISYQIILVYLLAMIFLYPVIAHILMFPLGYMTDKLPHGKFWIYIQIFMSGPGLIILGILLYFKYGGLVNKIFGICFFIVALCWLCNIASDVIKEAA